MGECVQVDHDVCQATNTSVGSHFSRRYNKVADQNWYPELYQYWLEYGYNDLIDHILEDSHSSQDEERCIQPHQYHVRPEQEAWTSKGRSHC